jgi:hypothetical protein
MTVSPKLADARSLTKAGPLLLLGPLDAQRTRADPRSWPSWPVSQRMFLNYICDRAPRCQLNRRSIWAGQGLVVGRSGLVVKIGRLSASYSAGRLSFEFLDDRVALASVCAR